MAALIVVIGVGGRFPGDATNPEKLWEMISNSQSWRHLDGRMAGVRLRDVLADAGATNVTTT